MRDEEAEAHASAARLEARWAEPVRGRSWCRVAHGGCWFAETGGTAVDGKPWWNAATCWVPTSAWCRTKERPGVDGLPVSEFKPWLQRHWVRVRQDLLTGVYQPEAVRKVEIPKPQGGVRTLGIPTVLDRLIQQALNQVLQPLLDPKFSASSYGFRPGPNAHQAVQACPRLRCGRKAVGRRSRFGEVLRPCESRRAYGTCGAQGGARTGAEADPSLSGGDD